MRSNRVYKVMNRPLTILGAERRLFFVALLSGAGVFNLLHSLMGGILLFTVGLVAAQQATKFDTEILRVLLNSAKFLEKKKAPLAASESNAGSGSPDEPASSGLEAPVTETTSEAIPATSRQDKF